MFCNLYIADIKKLKALEKNLVLDFIDIYVVLLILLLI